MNFKNCYANTKQVYKNHNWNLFQSSSSLSICACFCICIVIIYASLFMFWAVFLCLQWVLFLFEAGCSLGIKDEIILYLPHKILWLMFSSPWLFFIKMRSLCQIFSSNVANFSYYQNSMATLLMRGFYLGVVVCIKSWRSRHIVFRKIINVILTFTDNFVKECWWFAA